MKWERFFKALFWLQVGINLIGALGPELSFDALWYHLPIARMLSEHGTWGTVQGGLLYHSGFPRLMDWIYGGLLWTGRGTESPEFLPKLLHYLLGVGSGLLIARMGGWAAAVIWYATPLVGWLSVTAYIDLARTFFVLLSVFYLTQRRPYRSALAMGVAYSVKILSGIEAMALTFIWGWTARNWKASAKYLLVVAPFVVSWGLLNLSQHYGFFYPLGQFGVVREHVAWSWSVITGPMIGDGRYILPELALLAIWLSRHASIKKWILVGAITQGLVGMGYRGLANLKFVPYLLGQENKDVFLTNRLNFAYGDWYDADGWVRAHLVDKKYLVVGVHNTYYLPGSQWDHESWADMGSCYSHVLAQGAGDLHPDWQLVHEVPQTDTRIYETRCL